MITPSIEINETTEDNDLRAVSSLDGELIEVNIEFSLAVGISRNGLLGIDYRDLPLTEEINLYPIEKCGQDIGWYLTTEIGETEPRSVISNSGLEYGIGEVPIEKEKRKDQERKLMNNVLSFAINEEGNLDLEKLDAVEKVCNKVYELGKSTCVAPLCLSKIAKYRGDLETFKSLASKGTGEVSRLGIDNMFYLVEELENSVVE